MLNSLITGADKSGKANAIRSNKTFVVRSDQPIKVTASNYTEFSPDKFYLLDTQTLGTDYIVSSYSNNPGLLSTSGTEPQSRSVFSIIATVDNTVITIIPTAYITYNGLITNKGELLTITLNKGEVFSAASDKWNDDYSGTVISADKKM